MRAAVVGERPPGYAHRRRGLVDRDHCRLERRGVVRVTGKVGRDLVRASVARRGRARPVARRARSYIAEGYHRAEHVAHALHTVGEPARRTRATVVGSRPPDYG